jgi:peptidoglycan hydrolase CwlO-like protein
MEIKVLEILFKGGFIAIFGFLIYIILDIKKKQEDIQQQVKSLDSEKLSIEEFYRMFSGWREEIRELNHKIDSLKDAIIKELIK